MCISLLLHALTSVVGEGGGLFLRWWSPSTMCAGHLIFNHHQDVWLIPYFFWFGFLCCMLITILHVSSRIVHNISESSYTHFSCNQAALWMVQSVCPSVCLPVRHTFYAMFPSSYHYEILKIYYLWQKWCWCKRSRSEVKGQGHRSQNKLCPNLGVSRPSWILQFEFSNSYEMMHNAWTGIEEVPYCFSRSSVKFQGHTGQRIADFGPNLAFPVCNSSLNSQMSMKWFTELEVA